jgi:hypothetical protein
MLNVVMLNVVMLNVVLLNVVMLSVVAPFQRNVAYSAGESVTASKRFIVRVPGKYGATTFSMVRWYLLACTLLT